MEKDLYLLQKQEGETPLECIERAKEEGVIPKGQKATYAGRLDPMASGLLLVLTGEKVHEKEKYLSFDKEYEVEVLFGVSTDTGDVLGEIQSVKKDFILNKEDLSVAIQKCIGEFEEHYPKYSSKTIEGKPVFLLARLGKVFKSPKHTVKIHSIEVISDKSMTGEEIASLNISRIQKVKGDFRQKDIVAGWNEFASSHGSEVFQIVKVRVTCGSGAYMRVLAEKIGKRLGCTGLAYSIKRTRVGDYDLV
ncbi:hypothetical protein H6790_02170 [Candidatus Nomurabacteria bacterium]|nr:hypothetical protein [Candidatus Nomurabacteria bacterium]